MVSYGKYTDMQLQYICNYLNLRYFNEDVGERDQGKIWERIGTAELWMWKWAHIILHRIWSLIINSQQHLPYDVTTYVHI
jgi:hypothetical protein